MLTISALKCVFIYIALCVMLCLVSCDKGEKKGPDSKTRAETALAEKSDTSNTSDNDDIPTLDLSTPEKALDYYINVLRKGKVDLIYKVCPNAKDFYLPGPINISDYSITKKIVFDEDDVKSWNDIGIIPPAQLGDIELQVKEMYAGSDSGYMFSYWLRLYRDQWKIFTHSAWDHPDNYIDEIP
jgi:hypothetical protein